MPYFFHFQLIFDCDIDFFVREKFIEHLWVK